MNKVEAMRKRLIDIAVMIRREQVALGVGPLDFPTDRLAELHALYHRLQPAYARELDSTNTDKHPQASREAS